MITVLAWLVFAAAAGVAFRFFVGDHRDIQLVRETDWGPVDQSRTVSEVIATINRARRLLTIIDFSTVPESSIHQNRDILEAIDRRIEERPDLRVCFAAAAPRPTWLMHQLVEREHSIVMENGPEVGRAFEAIADEGDYAYLVTGFGRARSLDGSAAPPAAITTVMGEQLETAAAIFGPSALAEQEAALSEHHVIRTR